MYTELATMYAKYKPKMLMDFIKMNIQKLNIPKLINACERHYHWEHAVFLYTHYDEYDQAANTMMAGDLSAAVPWMLHFELQAHSPVAFAHDQFLMIMQKVSNMELYYRAVQFYLDEQPLQLNSLLSTITPKVDHARVVQQVRKLGQLPLIMPYMKQVQQHNIAPVNEAINELYVDGEQYEELRQSIEASFFGHSEDVPESVASQVANHRPEWATTFILAAITGTKSCDNFDGIVSTMTEKFANKLGQWMKEAEYQVQDFGALDMKLHKAWSGQTAPKPCQQDVGTWPMDDVLIYDHCEWQLFVGSLVCPIVQSDFASSG
ncbi:unnamed protein product [Symbiodinium sp. KB8]|nr:unnamed protein product [Symbiodinium sp. KB8]